MRFIILGLILLTILFLGLAIVLLTHEGPPTFEEEVTVLEAEEFRSQEPIPTPSQKVSSSPFRASGQPPPPRSQEELEDRFQRLEERERRLGRPVVRGTPSLILNLQPPSPTETPTE